MKTLKTGILPSPTGRFTALATAFLVAGGLLLAPTFSRAQDAQDDAAFTCASAVNVMDCIQQTGTGAPKAADITAVPVNSQALGFTGPITAGIRYDNYLAWILDVGYAQEFYNSAAAFKLSAGLNERRANVTLGYAISPKQQIKLTYEYLAQNLPFDYASGQVNEWVSQNAFGGAYRYLLDNGIVRALEVYGTYTKAASKELSDVEMYTDDVLTAINYRRIAGGTEMTAGTIVTITPFKNTIVKLGGGYSTLSFDTKWEDSAATSAIAYSAELSHLLTPTTLISTGIGNTASGRTHTARVSQILPWNLEASLMGQYTATTNDIPSSTSVTAQLSYPAPKTYTNMFADGIGKLKDWVEKPVIYHTRVLAKAEERVVAVQITTNPIPATSIPVGSTLSPEIQTKDYFIYNTGIFDKINYKILSVNTTDGAPASTNLNLVVAPVDSFNAVVKSSAPTTTDMMTPGQYIVTLEAQGYRNGQVVSQIDNAMDTNVGVNPNLAAPTWNTDMTLPVVMTKTDYPTTALKPYVKGNSTLGNTENYNFKLDGNQNPPWVKISNDQQSLIANGPAGDPGTATVTLIATSTASGQPTLANPFTITITETASLAPSWVSPGVSLPPAVTAVVYPVTPLTPYVQNNNTSTIPNETYKFKLAGTDNPDWLEISADQLSLVGKGNAPAAGTSATVTVVATSDQTGKSSVSNTFPIDVIETTAVPVWSNNGNLAVTIPYDVNKTDYQLAIAPSSANYVEPADSIIGQMNITKNLPSGGIISGVTNTKDTYYVTINISNQLDVNGQAGIFSVVATNKDDTTKKSTGTFTVNITPNTTATPQWIDGKELPSAIFNTTYQNVDLTQYVKDDSGVPVSTDAKSTANNYKFEITGGNPGWLGIAQNQTTLIGVGPVTSEAGKPVTIQLKATNGFGKSVGPTNFTINVESLDSPTWNPPPLVPKLYYYTGTQPVYIYQQGVPSYVTPVPGDDTVTITGPYDIVQPATKTTSTATIPPEFVLSPTKVYISINTNNLGDIGNNGYFTAKANGTNGQFSSGQFTVSILPNSTDLTAFSKTNTDLPKAEYGVTYSPVQLDPYTNPSAAGDQITPTTLKTDSTKTVPDTLKFAINTSPSQTPLCQWTEVVNGVLQQKASTAITGGNCWVSYKIHSQATGTDPIFEKQILVGSAPVWVADLTAKIEFNDTATGVELNQFLNSTGANDPDIRFTFEDQKTDIPNWTIQSTGTDPNVPRKFYLRRTGSDASDVGKEIPLTLYAFNSNSPPTGVQGILKVTVEPADQVFYKWVGNQIAATVGKTDVTTPLDSSTIQTYLDASYTQRVTNDTFSAITLSETNLPTGGKVTISGPSEAFILNVLASKMMNPDLGTPEGLYDLTFTGITSKAGGGKLGETTGSQALKVIANTALNTISGNRLSDARMKFTSTDPTKATDTYNLSSQLHYLNGPGIVFTMDTTNATWDIVQNAGSYILVRKVVNNQLNAGDINQNTMLTVTVTATSPATPTTATIQATALTDTNIQPTLIFPEFNIKNPSSNYYITVAAKNTTTYYGLLRSNNSGMQIQNEKYTDVQTKDHLPHLKATDDSSFNINLGGFKLYEDGQWKFYIDADRLSTTSTNGICNPSNKDRLYFVTFDTFNITSSSSGVKVVTNTVTKSNSAKITCNP